jgi:hypothetical protein
MITKRRKRKKSGFDGMGWPTIKFHPKTGKKVSNCVMNPVTGAVYPKTAAGYKKAANDFNRFR